MDPGRHPQTVGLGRPTGVKVSVTRGRPTRIQVRPGGSHSWGGTPAPTDTPRAHRPGLRTLAVTRAPSPPPSIHPVMRQFKDDLAYAMYKLKRRGRHMERDIVRHYSDVRQMAEEREEKELYGNKFHRKCLKMAASSLPGTGFFSPRSTTTSMSTSGSCMCTPRTGRDVLGLRSIQNTGASDDQRPSLFRPSVDLDIMPPVD